MYKPKECPCCSTKAWVNEQGHIRNGLRRVAYSVHCPECGLMTLPFDTFGEALAAWNSRAEPENEPLTLDELREMHGEPVRIVEYPDWGHWELSADAEDYFENRDEDFYGMMMPDDPMGRYGLHMLGWLAYRHKPKGEV